ncbi:hypothetical protein ACH4C6_11610 [Streptomyces sp. NPDC017943]|uniref:hypothetical protein n=1 Tax=Streptomyces sp. NPDC017943 TaxID=3365019 RepID=UPI0037AFB0B0
MSGQSLHDEVQKRSVGGGAGRTTVLYLPLIAAAPVAGRLAVRGRVARTSTTGSGT